MVQDANRLHGIRRFYGALTWICALLGIGGLIGLVVSLVLLGLGSEQIVLHASLCGGFTGLCMLSGGLGYLFGRLGDRYALKELDALELLDGKNSFFVGEGMLATFEKDTLRIHGKTGKSILCPLGELRFFSVCTRRAPRERGEWSVVIEIPAKYFKKGKAEGDERAMLIQTSAKERLYDCLEAHGLLLLGEKRQENGGKPFQKLRSFFLPDPKKRRRALLAMLIGGILLAAGVGVAFWQVAIGAAVCVIGLYFGIRGAMGYLRAKAVFEVFREGIYYREPQRLDDAFLKWEEILSVEETEGDRLRANCLYGAYDFPRFPGLYDYLKTQFPEKCKEER